MNWTERKRKDGTEWKRKDGMDGTELKVKERIGKKRMERKGKESKEDGLLGELKACLSSNLLSRTGHSSFFTS